MILVSKCCYIMSNIVSWKCKFWYLPQRASLSCVGSHMVPYLMVTKADKNPIFLPSWKCGGGGNRPPLGGIPPGPPIIGGGPPKSPGLPNWGPMPSGGGMPPGLGGPCPIFIPVNKYMISGLIDQLMTQYMLKVHEIYFDPAKKNTQNCKFKLLPTMCFWKIVTDIDQDLS